MRLVRIKNLEYKDFETIRDAIFDVIPFAILESVYSTKLRTGFFNFWDSDYIPDELKQFIVQPPVGREEKEILKQRILTVFENIKKLNKVE